MKIKVLSSFSEKLAQQIEYIAQDKPAAAQRFKQEVIDAIKALAEMPYKQRQSIYFEDESIRELIFKGYKIVYRIRESENCIEVFGFVKYEKGISK